MTETSKFKTGRIIAFSLAVVLGFLSYLIKKYAYNLTFWIHGDILNKGNSIETDAAFIVMILYVIVTYIAVLLLMTAITGLFYNRSLFSITHSQLCRYFAFLFLLPSLIAISGWDTFWIFIPVGATNGAYSLPNIQPFLSITNDFCDLILVIMIVTVLLSIVSFAYGVRVNSSIYINGISLILGIAYLYSALQILLSCIEYGKWLLIIIAIEYAIVLINLVFIKHKSSPLIPKYDVVVVPLSEKVEKD